MRLLSFLSLVVAALAQTQTESLGISATATPSASLPITPPPQRPLAACSADPLWRRLRNAAGVDPCALAMNLQQMCTTIDPIPALTGGESYTGPTSVEAATPCICTTVMYNLVAACAACQHQLSTNVKRNWVPWSTWSALCQSRSQIVDGAWGRVTTYNSTIPEWAFAKVFQSDLFNLQQAVNIGVTSSSSLPSPTSSASPSPSNDVQVGAIVGGVLGGVGFLLLLLTCFFCFLRRRQRKWEKNEGVNQPHSSPYIVGKQPNSLQKPVDNKYGVGGLTSPSRERFEEKPRPVVTETALPDVLADEHRQGKPEYSYPGGNGFGYGARRQQGEYVPVANPGVAGIGAGGRGLAAPTPVSRVPPRDGPEGAAAQMLAADAATANRYGEGIFREDFSASEGHGYRSSTDAESRHFRNGGNGNGNGRGVHPPSSFPFSNAPVPGRSGNGNSGIGGLGTLAAERPDEDTHAYSTVGDASISLYPSSADHPTEAPPPFIGGFKAPPEKEEYRLPDRGYSSGYAIPESGGSGSGGSGNGEGSPRFETDPFAANRRPAAFSRVFGDRPSPGAGGSGVNRSPTAAQGQGNSPVLHRPGGSPVLTRAAGPNPVQTRRGGGPTGAPQNMGFGRQHQAAVGALNRDSGAFSDESSPTAVGFAGDIGSARGEGSPLPSGPFAGRSGFGVGR